MDTCPLMVAADGTNGGSGIAVTHHTLSRHPRGNLKVRQEICKSLTDRVICPKLTLRLPGIVGFNRQLNRQQKEVDEVS